MLFAKQTTMTWEALLCSLVTSCLLVQLITFAVITWAVLRYIRARRLAINIVAYNGIEVEWEVLCNDFAVLFPHFSSLPPYLASLADRPLSNVIALSFEGQA